MSSSPSDPTSDDASDLPGDSSSDTSETEEKATRRSNTEKDLNQFYHSCSAMLKTPVKQLPGKLQSVHTQFVEQYSPKDTITSTSEGESEILPLDIKDNVSDSIHA